MSLLETFICSLDVTGVVLEPNANAADINRVAETPFTVFFDLEKGKFTNDVGGDFTITATAQDVRQPWYVFSINGYAIGSRGVNETGILKIKDGHLTPPAARNSSDSRPDWENRARVAELSRHGLGGYFGEKSHIYDFLVGEEYANVDPESMDHFILNVDVYEYDEGDGPYKASIRSSSTIFPKPHRTTGELPTPVASNAIRVRISNEETKGVSGQLTKQLLNLSTDQDLSTSDNLSLINLESATGDFIILEEGTPVVASEYEVIDPIGLEAIIDDQGSFSITRVTSLDSDKKASIAFRATHQFMVNDTPIITTVERTFTLKVQSTYVSPVPPPLDYGIPYDEIVGNITLSPYRLCSFNYNFHMEKYESFIASNSVSHNLLPCYYNNIFYLNNKELSSNYSLQEAVKSITLDGKAPVSENPSLSIPSTSKITKAQETVLKKHYNNLGTILRDAQEGELESISSNMSYKMISDTEYDKFLESEDSKKVFPFYNEISIPKAETKTYGKILEKYKKFDDFKVLNNLFADIPSIPVTYNGEETNKRLKIANLLGDTENTLYGNAQAEDSYMVYADPEDTNLVPASMLEYRQSTIEDFMLIDKIIKNRITLIENEEIVRQNEELLELYEMEQSSIGGESEILYYKIKKYEKEIGPTPVTTICIPNKDNTANLKYIDTQVKTNKDYFYVIEAVILCRSTSEESSLTFHLPGRILSARSTDHSLSPI